MATATIPTQAYPPKYHLPETELAQIGTVGVKTLHKQMPGKKMASVLVLFESAMTDEKFLPKKMVGRELHVYPDMDDAAAASPFPIGDTRAATNYYRGRRARRWSRNRIHPRADREDRLVYPFLSIGRRSNMALPKEKEITSVTELIKEKQVPKYLVNNQYVPELDGEDLGFKPGYHEPHYPIVDIKNPDPKAMQFSYNPHQYERRLVHIPYLRTVKLRWIGRLFERRSGQRFWPTQSISSIPRMGHGPWNWGSYKDSDVAKEDAEGQAMADIEKSKDEYYALQPSNVPHLATMEEFLPDVLLDEISEQEWLEGPVEDGMEGYFYDVSEDQPAKDIETEDLEHADYYAEEKMAEDEYERMVKSRPPHVQHLDPSKVAIEDPENANYYWELMTPPSKRKGKGTGTPQAARKTPERKTPTVTDQIDKAWVPLPAHKMMWEFEEVKQRELAAGDKPETSFATKIRYGFDTLNEETK